MKTHILKHWFCICPFSKEKRFFMKENESDKNARLFVFCEKDGQYTHPKNGVRRKPHITVMPVRDISRPQANKVGVAFFWGTQRHAVGMMKEIRNQAPSFRESMKMAKNPRSASAGAKSKFQPVGS